MEKTNSQNKSWFSIQAKAGGSDTAVVKVFDQIGFYGVTAQDFRDQLAQQGFDDSGKAKAIELLIDTEGGDVFQGWSMVNALREHPAKVTARIVGLAASMGSVLMLAADSIEGYENSFVMIHNPWTIVGGDAEQMENTAQNLRMVQDKIVRAYVDKTGKTYDDISAMMKVETLMDGETAKELGFIDVLLSEFKAAALASKWDGVPRNQLPAGLAVVTGENNQPEEASTPEPEKPKNKPTAMSETTTEPKKPAPVMSVKDVYAEDKPRRDEIKAIGAKFSISDDKIEHAIENGVEIGDFRNSVIDNFDPNSNIVSDIKADKLKGAYSVGDIEASKFSMFKALREQVDGGGLTGLEKEVQNTLSEKYHAATGEAPTGILIPAEWWNKRVGGINNVSTVGTGTTGGNTVDTEMQEPTDYLSDYSILPELGATIFRDASGNLEFPRATAGYTGNWDAETDAISAGDPTWAANLVLTPKRVGSLAKVSKKLLLQSSVDFEAWVRAKLQKAIAEAVDRAAIIGTGSNDQPTGLLNTSGLGSYTWVTGSAAWVNIVDQVAVLRAANGDLGRSSWLTDHTVRADWKKTPVVSGASNMIIERGFRPREAMVDDLPFLDHTAVTTGKVALGNWSDLLTALWGGIQLTFDPYTSKASGQVELYAETFADVGVLQPASFVIGNDGTDHAGSIA